MKTRILIIHFTFLLGTIACAQVGLSRDELKLFNLLNQERAKAGLAKLQWDHHLAQSARDHTKLQASRGVLSHQLSGEPTLGERIGATGVRFNIGAENVAEGETVEDIHAGLMHSPEHRANILSPKYNSIGVAIVSHGDELYVTEDFANILPAYSEQQFRDAVAAAFNKARQSSGIAELAVRPEVHLHDVACSEDNNAQQIIHELPNALNLVVFTTAEPDKLPNSMQKAAANRSLRRMDIGACFRPSKEHGYGSFRVVAAFYQ